MPRSYRSPAGSRATATDTPLRVPSRLRVTRTGLETIKAARNLPVGDNVAAADVTCARALGIVQAAAIAVIAPATASLRVHMIHPTSRLFALMDPIPPAGRHKAVPACERTGPSYAAGPCVSAVE